ncbi:Helix-turn-helix domain protein [Symmachiella dynata]|uniref:Helix-turn-helix domain protein n=1 Tax=Symmachiella dynata TaxID=2527995 RepID=A0A517ZRT2_9PLAN|nr:helix-turn-helix domain-containing protein [Symmachiella dynata]QDU45189.1 Helix-turn-helix domain protein [Symmachiella dynata]
MPEQHGFDTSLLLTVEQVAQLLQVSPRSVWRLRSAGDLPKPVKIGGAVRWIGEELRHWIASGCPKPT